MNIVEFLTANGIEVVYKPTCAIKLPNGESAFVRERDNGQVIIDHPPRGGRAGWYTQRSKTREGALKLINAYKPRTK